MALNLIKNKVAIIYHSKAKSYVLLFISNFHHSKHYDLYQLCCEVSVTKFQMF